MTVYDVIECWLAAVLIFANACSYDHGMLPESLPLRSLQHQHLFPWDRFHKLRTAFYLIQITWFRLWVSALTQRLHLHLAEIKYEIMQISHSTNPAGSSQFQYLWTRAQISAQSRNLFPVLLSHSGAPQKKKHTCRFGLTHLPFNPEGSLDSC